MEYIGKITFFRFFLANTAGNNSVHKEEQASKQALLSTKYSFGSPKSHAKRSGTILLISEV